MNYYKYTVGDYVKVDERPDLKGHHFIKSDSLYSNYTGDNSYHCRCGLVVDEIGDMVLYWVKDEDGNHCNFDDFIICPIGEESHLVADIVE